MTHTNSECNEWFKLAIIKWREQYQSVVHWNDGSREKNPIGNNRLPVFFDMEQSANVLALASWYLVRDVTEDGIYNNDEYGNPKYVNATARNPLHILSIERTSNDKSEYTLSEYT